MALENPIPAGRVAFYIDPTDHELHYSIVRVKGRYSANFDILELPRGEPDSFDIKPTLPEVDGNYRVVVELHKEDRTLKRLGIDYEGDPLAALEANGYQYERTEDVVEAGARELSEEHGFSMTRDKDMIRKIIAMKPFPVASSYGAKEEYRDFAYIEGDISRIPLNVTDKTESKAPGRKGTYYQEIGGWASLREIRACADAFVALAEADMSPDKARMMGEARYQKSIADWLETAEAALVGQLKKSGVDAQTSSAIDPAIAMRQTGTKEIGQLNR